MHLLVVFRAGFPPTRTVIEPGAHGAGQAGTHGAGVIGRNGGGGGSSPNLAAVAAITAGLAGHIHKPKVMGGFGVSIIVATKRFCPFTVICEVTVKGAGAAPKVH